MVHQILIPKLDILELDGGGEIRQDGRHFGKQNNRVETKKKKKKK